MAGHWSWPYAIRRGEATAVGEPGKKKKHLNDERISRLNDRLRGVLEKSLNVGGVAEFDDQGGEVAFHEALIGPAHVVSQVPVPAHFGVPLDLLEFAVEVAVGGIGRRAVEADGPGGGGVLAVDGTGDGGADAEECGVKRGVVVEDATARVLERGAEVVVGAEGGGEEDHGANGFFGGEHFGGEDGDAAAAGVADDVDGVMGMSRQVFNDVVA